MCSRSRSRGGRARASVAELAAGIAQRGHQLQERLALELADALAGQAEVLAHLAEGHRHIRIEAEPMTLQEVGVQLGLSRERVRQLEQQALEKLMEVT